jgi:hypothetical protein
MRRRGFGKGRQAFEQPAAVSCRGSAILRHGRHVWIGSSSLRERRRIRVWCRHIVLLDVKELTLVSLTRSQSKPKLEEQESRWDA